MRHRARAQAWAGARNRCTALIVPFSRCICTTVVVLHSTESKVPLKSKHLFSFSASQACVAVFFSSKLAQLDGTCMWRQGDHFEIVCGLHWLNCCLLPHILGRVCVRERKCVCLPFSNYPFGFSDLLLYECNENFLLSLPFIWMARSR